MTTPAARDLPASVRSRWSSSGAVRLHWLEGHADATDRPALVFIPGFGEEALDHLPLIDALPARRVIIPDLRGRGLSDVPASGYGLAEHVGDLDVVLRDAGAFRTHVASYSRGTAYALRWALEHPELVVSLTVGDYPAEHIRPPDGAADFLAGRARFGRPMTDRISERTMRTVFADCTNEAYYEALSRVRFPLLLMYGGRRGSMVDVEILERYRASRPDCAFERFEDSAHDLWQPDPARFGRTLARFIDAADGG